MNSCQPDFVTPMGIREVGTHAARTATDAAATEALAQDRSGVHDFDFMVGHWRVRHRRTDPGKNQWFEFDGTSSTRATLDGAGNVEDNLIELPSGSYRAKAIRAFDSATGQWAIWWIDGRNPHGKLDPPVIGCFANGVGTFYCDDTIDGVATRVRFTWIFSEPDSARWEQAFSTDAGESWDTNWTMDFTRTRFDANAISKFAFQGRTIDSLQRPIYAVADSHDGASRATVAIDRSSTAQLCAPTFGQLDLLDAARHLLPLLLGRSLPSWPRVAEGISR